MPEQTIMRTAAPPKTQTPVISSIVKKTPSTASFLGRVFAKAPTISAQTVIKGLALGIFGIGCVGWAYTACYFLSEPDSYVKTCATNRDVQLSSASDYFTHGVAVTQLKVFSAVASIFSMSPVNMLNECAGAEYVKILDISTLDEDSLKTTFPYYRNGEHKYVNLLTSEETKQLVDKFGLSALNLMTIYQTESYVQSLNPVDIEKMSREVFQKIFENHDDSKISRMHAKKLSVENASAIMKKFNPGPDSPIILRTGKILKDRMAASTKTQQERAALSKDLTDFILNPHLELKYTQDLKLLLTLDGEFHVNFSEGKKSLHQKNEETLKYLNQLKNQLFLYVHPDKCVEALKDRCALATEKINQVVEALNPILKYKQSYEIL